nr:apyrase 2-like [Tanacetum cinerariifolium]
MAASIENDMSSVNYVASDVHDKRSSHGYMQLSESDKLAFKRHLTVRNDVYRFRVILLELLTGRSASGGYTEYQSVRRYVQTVSSGGGVALLTRVVIPKSVLVRLDSQGQLKVHSSGVLWKKQGGGDAAITFISPLTVYGSASGRYTEYQSSRRYVQMLKPGLSAYATDPKAAVDSLLPLLEKAEKENVGLRQLGVDASERILKVLMDFPQLTMTLTDGREESVMKPGVSNNDGSSSSSGGFALFGWQLTLDALDGFQALEPNQTVKFESVASLYKAFPFKLINSNNVSLCTTYCFLL